MHFRTASAIASGIRAASEHAGRPLPVLTDMGKMELEHDSELPEVIKTPNAAPAPTQRWVA